RLDARAMPQLPASDGRFWRLPLPGLPAHGQCRGHRPRVPSVPPPRDRGRGRTSSERQSGGTCRAGLPRTGAADAQYNETTRSEAVNSMKSMSRTWDRLSSSRSQCRAHPELETLEARLAPNNLFGLGDALLPEPRPGGALLWTATEFFPDRPG